MEQISSEQETPWDQRATIVCRAAVNVQATQDGTCTATLRGRWNLRGMAGCLPRLTDQLARVARNPQVVWDLRGVERLDLAGAMLLWRTWGDRWPQRAEIRDEHRQVLARIEQTEIRAQLPRRRLSLADFARNLLGAARSHARTAIGLLGQLVLDLGYLVAHPRHIPWREISATMYAAGTRALSITALVGVLIGIVVSFLSAVQLRRVGGDSYIVDVLGLSIIRELGPMLAAILVAGRSGSSMTAQLGVMRVTQELDALAVLGISPTIRLVVPKVIALVIALPLLVVWTAAMALLGGMISANNTLGLSYSQFLSRLPEVVPIANLWLGLGKAMVFGALIALTACHFGMRIEPNTQSLGRETTSAVVAAITQVILVNAIFAIVFQGVGFA